MSQVNFDSLLDFSSPFDVKVYDHLVERFSRGETDLQKYLIQFQEHEYAYTRVDAILEQSHNNQAKMMALMVLEKTVTVRWKILPPVQKEGIRTYIVGLIIKMSQNPETLKVYSTLLGKLNLVLVQILKQEWPHNWPSFIPDLVASSKTSPSLCANNLNILMILSEEVFDYAHGKMTEEKIKTMSQQFNQEFTSIFELCMYVLENSQDVQLLTSTLRTLERFLVWIPVWYIFETKLLDILSRKFFPAPIFQNNALICLSEIAALSVPDKPQYNNLFASMFVAVMEQTQRMIPGNIDLVKVYEEGNDSVRMFVKHLANFLTGFLKHHLSLLEGTEEARKVLLFSLNMLLRISLVDDKESDLVIFKLCLDYWLVLVQDLHTEHVNHLKKASKAPEFGGLVFGNMNESLQPRQQHAPRNQFYAETMHNLRLTLILKMAKPEEVLVVEDENGDVVREKQKDTDAILLYKTMKQALVYLTHIDPDDTKDIMLLKLSKQTDDSEWSYANLNVLCWAIGSISKALKEEVEKPFLVKVIRDLLALCENKKTKDAKAIIASNIMYVVGQYPRFLQNHWRFLATVVYKLFEFMHEKHPGVQDMSCDTFLKIANTCKKKFVVTQTDEQQPFIDTILQNLPKTIDYLEQSQIYTFYEAVAVLISAQVDPQAQQKLIFKLMEMPNQLWAQITTKANQSVEVLWDLQTVKQIVMVLATNNRVASAIGYGYVVQLSRIYVEMLQVYKLYSGYISNEIATKGVNVTQSYTIKQMRAVKKETLKLLVALARSCTASHEKNALLKDFMPQLLDPVLEDYKRNIAEARDSEVLALFVEFVKTLGPSISSSIPVIFGSVFECTLGMITKNFEDFPDHRLAFFNLLHAIVNHCCDAILQLSSAQFKLVVDSIVWACKHMERNISDTGLTIFLELLLKIQHTAVANSFYQTFYISLLHDILVVLMDSFHRSGFTLHVQILMQMFQVVEGGHVTAPLFPPQHASQFPNNVVYLREYIANFIRTSFPNVGQQQVQGFVVGLLQHCTNHAAFRTHVRDFIITLKEFSNGEENKQLYEEERLKEEAEKRAQEQAYIDSVPGLQFQSQLQQPQQRR